MASYFDSSSDDIWQYDFKKLTFAAVMVYSYCSLIPLLLHIALRFLGDTLPIAYLLCLYGYISVVFIPTAIICTIPWELLRWAAVTGAFVISGGALIGNLGNLVWAAAPAKGTMILIVLGCLHAALCLAFKLYFFEFAG